MYIYMYVYMYICIYIYTYIHIYIFICMYKETLGSRSLLDSELKTLEEEEDIAALLQAMRLYVTDPEVVDMTHISR